MTYSSGHALASFLHEVDGLVGVLADGVFEAGSGLETSSTGDLHDDTTGAGRARARKLGGGGGGLGGEGGGLVGVSSHNDSVRVELDGFGALVGAELFEDAIGLLLAVHVGARDYLGALPGAMGG